MFFRKAPLPKNQDGGPATAVFAFSLERERETATRLTDPAATDLLQARLRLIDAVQTYRLDGIQTDALLQACLDELELAPRNRSSLNVMSVGMKRLSELAADGHDKAANLVRAELGHPRAERRVTAYEHAFANWLDGAQRISACCEALADPSGDVRQIGATQAVRDGFHELAPLLDQAATGRIGERAKADIKHSAFMLRERHRLGLPKGAKLPDESWKRYDELRKKKSEF